MKAGRAATERRWEMEPSKAHLGASRRPSRTRRIKEGWRAFDARVAAWGSRTCASCSSTAASSWMTISLPSSPING